MNGGEVDIEATLGLSTLAVFLTEYSATAALDGYTRRKADFRAASLPGVERRMERTALAADYREVARRCGVIRDILLATPTAWRCRSRPAIAARSTSASAAPRSTTATCRATSRATA